MISFLQNIDIKMMNLLNKKFRYKFLDKIMILITTLGNGGFVWLIISTYLILNKNYRMQGYMIIASLIITTIIGEGIIKHLIKRTRPFVNMLENKLLISKPITYSFPSGHTASSFAAAGIFLNSDNKLSILIVILASLIAFSRIYLNVHYPTDVFTGIILGFLCSKLVITIFQSEMVNLSSQFNQSTAFNCNYSIVSAKIQNFLAFCPWLN
ncbi:phosphatase PAP2 family protein [Clostridium sp. SYSU_GA19001]|uniref:phosphatase PAP2 family protein n=1 Tax=Clostridium caldaquaticum TaxID=2940653 RepID=UPI0020775CE2|nr:phosphatase PAP2 family protein [Clostridium caldaquaticum]MCM8711566.1 phosphatase PAP2 family protein [Clostridium caldaquaticum]